MFIVGGLTRAGAPNRVPQAGEATFCGSSARPWRNGHQAKSDQLLPHLVSPPRGGAPLPLDIDQLLDGHRFDDPGLADEMHMAHRPGLDALETGEGPTLAGAGNQRHVVERLDRRLAQIFHQRP